MNAADLKVYLRILLKNKALSMINLFGLALGMASSFLIILYVTDELSFDSYNTNIDRIYRLTTEFVNEGASDPVVLSSTPLGSELKQRYGEVEEVVRFSFGNDVTIRYKDKLFKEAVIGNADNSVFRVFSYNLLSGNPLTALSAPNTVVLTSTFARKYFGEEDPLGKTLTINKTDHLVTGVMEDLPTRSDLKFPLLVSLNDKNEDWLDFSYRTYVLFNDQSIHSKNLVPTFEKRLADLAEEKLNKLMKAENQDMRVNFHLQPLRGLHFQNPLLYDTPKGNRQYVLLLSLVALFVLLVGCLNYINFSIVQSIERSREVGIRKVIGAKFSELVARYISESVVFTFIAMILSLGFVIFSLPIFNTIADKNFGISDLVNFQFAGYALITLLTVGIAAGSYPAFFTSSMKPVNALKGNLSTIKGQGIRKISIVTQFVISIGLVICTVIVFRQMTYLKNFDLGFRIRNVMVLNAPSDSTVLSKAILLKNNLLKSTAIESVTLGGLGAVPGGPTERGSVGLFTAGKTNERMVNLCFADADYLAALHIRLKQGRNFDAQRISDPENSVIVNEALVRMMGWNDPLNHVVQWIGKRKLNIIGVTSDFHYQSLHAIVEPQVFVHLDEKPWKPSSEQTLASSLRHVLISLNRKTPVNEGISQIQREWNVVFPDEPFVVRFLDESVNAQYAGEERAMYVFTSFSVLTVLISCLGLLGLSSLTVRQRKKEIGIRRIIGAGFTSILSLFSKEYIGLIFISFVIVSPLTWWLMNRWLESFSYREGIEVSVYAGTGIAIGLLSVLTIAFSIYRISNAKPSDLISHQ